MKAKLLIIIIPMLMLSGCGKDENPQAAFPENDNPPAVSKDADMPGPGAAEKDTLPSVAKDSEIPPPDPARTEDSQITPEGAVKMFADGLASADKVKYLSVIHGDQEARKIAEITLDYLSAMNDFETAFISQYGPDAGEEFFPIPTSEGMAAMQKSLDSMEIEIAGDQAICMVPDDEKPYILIRKEGLWYLDVGTMFGSNPQENKRMATMWSEVINMTRLMQKKVGAAGVTAEALYEEFDNKRTEISKK